MYLLLEIIQRQLSFMKLKLGFTVKLFAKPGFKVKLFAKPGFKVKPFMKPAFVKLSVREAQR